MSGSYKLSVFAGKVIAIDGPAGSGKSTTARMLAEKIGFIYLDTGAMYRAVTYFALQHGVSPEDGRALEAITRKIAITFEMINGVNHVFINDEDVTEAIRSPEVNDAVSPVSAHPGVREALVVRQRKLAEKGNVVAEGRDTTSVVFPDADLKIYLDASLEERARRRMLEYTRSGMQTTIAEQKDLLSRRDRIDSGRINSPLKKTRDSILVDTTNLNIEEQVDRVLALIKTRLKAV